jgi:hypothetical protein
VAYPRGLAVRLVLLLLLDAASLLEDAGDMQQQD